MANSNTNSVEQRSAVHSFSTTFNKNGNITITFYEGMKQRHIKLVGGTPPALDYAAAIEAHDATGFYRSETLLTRTTLGWLRKSYIFKKHPNNASLFYPTQKSITNSLKQ